MYNDNVVDKYWKERIYPQEKTFVDFVENLTKWYFTNV